MIAFTNYDFQHLPPNKLLDWVGLTNFTTSGAWVPSVQPSVLFFLGLLSGLYLHLLCKSYSVSLQLLLLTNHSSKENVSLVLSSFSLGLFQPSSLSWHSQTCSTIVSGHQCASSSAPLRRFSHSWMGFSFLGKRILLGRRLLWLWCKVGSASLTFTSWHSESCNLFQTIFTKQPILMGPTLGKNSATSLSQWSWRLRHLLWSVNTPQL